MCVNIEGASGCWWKKQIQNKVSYHLCQETNLSIYVLTYIQKDKQETASNLRRGTGRQGKRETSSFL